MKRGRALRASLVVAVSTMVLFLVIIHVFRISSVVKGMDEETDSRAETASVKAEENYVLGNVLQGDIVDNEGTLIAGVQGTEGNEKKVVYKDDEAYSQTIGFVNNNGETARSAYLCDMTSGIGQYLYESEDYTKGDTVQVTLNSVMQEKAYNLLKSNGKSGSIAIMDAKTGALLSLAYYPSFNVNGDLTSWENQLADQGAVAYPMQAPTVPGSVFKLITSIGIVEKGLQDQVYTDTGKYVISEEDKLSNSNEAVYGDIAFKDAFSNSVNSYFAYMGTECLGKSYLEEIAKRCMIGDTLQFDFGKIKSNFAIDDTKSELARTSIGQGRTQLTTVQMAMITQALTNKGTMMKPYMVEKITKGSLKDTAAEESKTEETESAAVPGSVKSEIEKVNTEEAEQADKDKDKNEEKEEEPVYQNQVEDFTKITDKKTAAVITDAMTYTGENNNAVISTGINQYKLGIKTGTAQIGTVDGQELQHNVWMTSFAPAEDPKYIIVMNRYNVEGYGIDLLPEIESLYQELFLREEHPDQQQ
ncbi:MAG: hypothetical protein EOM40_04995 [Clostridia bacterium]|nr:hypothetical protein [Clostridia bacterium]NCC42101.1 hypothetical protein [Clostridia bacterium]